MIDFMTVQMDWSWLANPSGLFLMAFLAASLLPFGSEWLLVLLVTQGGDPLQLWLVASAGNVLGSCLNYVLGLWAEKWVHKHSEATGWDTARRWYQRFGVWSLLFAWVPVVGDPLTFIAGLMRARFVLFLPLVIIGKATRYALVIAVVI